MDRRLVPQKGGQLNLARTQDNQILISDYDEILTRGVLSQLPNDWRTSSPSPGYTRPRCWCRTGLLRPQTLTGNCSASKFESGASAIGGRGTGLSTVERRCSLCNGPGGYIF
jgi:hypothetical protein